MTTTADLRAGLRVSIASIAWTLLASTAAVIAGVVGHVLVLIVFGATGLLDAAGSAALALHFRHALRHEEVSEARERFALRVVSAGLIAIGILTSVESARRLIAGSTPHRSIPGIVIAASSIAVLTALTARKRVVARRVGSDALMADGWLSATGAVLGLVAVVGTAFQNRPELHWVDPAAALVIALVAASFGTVTLRKESAELR